MRRSKGFALVLSVLALLQALPALAQANDIKLMTINCYCFPTGKTSLLKGLTSIGNFLAPAVGKKVDVVDLQKGIQKEAPQRIDEIAAQILRNSPDVIFFQELWGDDNKNRMIDRLSANYKYNYWNDKNRHGVTELDDGLLIMSRWVPYHTACLQYEHTYDDEKHANKGALLMALYNPQNGFITLVNTHMQSGTDNEACATKEAQIREIGEWVRGLKRKDWRIANSDFIVGGDFNEPFCLQADKGQIIDRTAYLTRVYNQEGMPLNNLQMRDWLCNHYKINKVVEVDQIRRGGAILAKGQPGAEMLSAEDPVAGRFNGGSGGQWTYWAVASEPTGWQVLDHFFMNPARCKMKSFIVLRSEFLGDRRPDVAFDPYKAISDHAALVMVVGLPNGLP